MKNLDEQTAGIRRFLLRQLSEEDAAQIEERIFGDAIFAEEVNIVEEELVAAYRAGELSAEERAHFERQYLATSARLQLVEFDGVFGRFVNSRLGETEPTPVETPAVVTAPPSASWLSRLRAFFADRPAPAYSLLAACLALLVSGLWYLNSKGPAADAPSSATRQEREQELARLNKEAGTPPGIVLTAVELEPAQRGVGAMTRVAAMARVGQATPAPGGLIELRLNLPQTATSPYRAVFRNDRGHELFAVSDLPAGPTPAGPQLRLYVPADYFTRGDYRIDLSATGKGGGYELLNSYAFRIVQAN